MSLIGVVVVATDLLSEYRKAVIRFFVRSQRLFSSLTGTDRCSGRFPRG